MDKIKSLSTPDRYERAVAFYINTIDGVLAERPVVGTKYPDVRIKYNDISTWLEVKMNETDQMGAPRVSFDGDQWVGKKSPVQNFTVDVLNQSDSAQSFVSDLKDFLFSDIKIPSTKGGLKDSSAVSHFAMGEFLSQRKNSYICTIRNADLGNLIAQHYNFGKLESAHYIQAGDQLFVLGDENPLKLDVPKLEAFGDFKVRISNRSQFYEVLPEIKISKDLYSPYSLAPGTLKPHPF